MTGNRITQMKMERSRIPEALKEQVLGSKH
jgi:hypothetical protein